MCLYSVLAGARELRFANLEEENKSIQVIVAPYALACRFSRFCLARAWLSLSSRPSSDSWDRTNCFLKALRDFLDKFDFFCEGIFLEFVKPSTRQKIIWKKC